MSSARAKRDQNRPHTKIVATIGPASEERIGELLDAGMNVARLNFSHGGADEHRRRVRKLREEAQKRMRSVCILGDLPGPKMRIGSLVGGERELEEGDVVRLSTSDEPAGTGEVHFAFTGYEDVVEVGHRVLLADGLVHLVVESVDGGVLTARVEQGGPISDRKGVHMPDSMIRYDLPTDADREWIELAKEIGIDMLGVSFVGNAEELGRIRELAPELSLVAKIERRIAIANLAEILDACDGIMVARGDLGVELDLEEVPMEQKAMIALALRAGKFTITATEMLESMIHSSRPTRAEVGDVANAVLDGTDAIMLSAETAVGEYPVEAVTTMRRIAYATEQSQRYHDLPRVAFRSEERDFANAIALAATEVAEALNLRLIVCFTEGGRTVRLISRYRPFAQIIALSPHERTVQTLGVVAHVRPILFRREPSLEDMLYVASEMLVVRGLAEYGEEIVFVAGVPPGVSRSTNVMKLHRIGEEIKLH